MQRRSASDETPNPGLPGSTLSTRGPSLASHDHAGEQKQQKLVDTAVQDATHVKADLLRLISDELRPTLANLDERLGRYTSVSAQERHTSLVLAGADVGRIQGVINEVWAKSRHANSLGQPDIPAVQNPPESAHTSLLDRKLSELQRLRSDNDAIMRTLTTNLQSPLTALLLTIDLLGQHPSEDTVSRRISAARRSAARISRLIRQLWIAGEIESDTLAVQGQVVHVQQLTHEAMHTAMPRFAERSLRLGLDVPEDPIHVYVDPTRFRQMLEALLLGLAEFSPINSSVVVSLGSRSWSDQDVELQVLAPELGLSAQALRQLRLKRAWTATGTTPGDAFGDYSFYIASELARMLGLGMRFEATSDVGTCFSFYLRSSGI